MGRSIRQRWRWSTRPIRIHENVVMASSSSSLTENYVYNSSFFSKFLLLQTTSSGGPFSPHFSCGKHLQELLSLYAYLTANYVFKSSFASALGVLIQSYYLRKKSSYGWR